MKDRPLDASVEVIDCGRGVRQLLFREPKNRLNGALRGQLQHALDNATALPEVRAIVIGTTGKHFSVGGDVNAMQNLTDASVSYKYAYMSEVNRLAESLGRCRKPLVAAISGACYGAGAGVALLCDTIVIGRSTEIGFPFLRTGLVPDFGISYTLKRRIGERAARQLLLYAKVVSAPEAIALGLADESVEDSEVIPRAIELANRLADMPAEALGLVKEMLRADPTSLEAALREEAMTQSHCLGSNDMREGVAAFLEKRSPIFNAN